MANKPKIKKAPAISDLERDLRDQGAFGGDGWTEVVRLLEQMHALEENRVRLSTVPGTIRLTYQSRPHNIVFA
jgi:hypothetical protein